ncbi:MAG: hypothetical protein L3J07_02410 [Candidatus Magasanikbacteria bacterium]|nr:hypothetical protein [Candidatus Magasanikbacteria bacterium]
MDTQVESVDYISIFLMTLVNSLIESTYTIAIYFLCFSVFIFFVVFLVREILKKRLREEVLIILYLNRCFINSEKSFPFTRIRSEMSFKKDIKPKQIAKLLANLIYRELIQEVKDRKNSLYWNEKHYALTQKGRNLFIST